LRDFVTDLCITWCEACAVKELVDVHFINDGEVLLAQHSNQLSLLLLLHQRDVSQGHWIPVEAFRDEDERHSIRLHCRGIGSLQAILILTQC